MRKAILSVWIASSLALTALPALSSDSLSHVRVASHEAVPQGPGLPGPTGLGRAFAQPAFATCRGVTICSLEEPSRSGLDVIWEKSRIPCGKDHVAVEICRPSLPGHFPVVVLLHGSHGVALGTEKYYLRHAEELAKNGFASLFVRYYDRGRKGRGNRTLWTKTIEDTLSYASHQPWADPDRMALLGFSQGAFLALNDAPSDERIRAVVAFYGGLSPGDVPQAKQNMPPILLFHGTADGIVPVRRSLETLTWLREEGRPADLVVYPGAGHGFLLNSRGGADAKAAEDSWYRTVAFLNFHLRYPAWTPAVEKAEPNDGGLHQTPADATELFTQAPFRTIPYLESVPLAGGEEFGLVNPPTDEVKAIATSQPLRKWKHHHKASKKTNARHKAGAVKAPSSAAGKSSAKAAVAKPAQKPAATSAKKPATSSPKKPTAPTAPKSSKGSGQSKK